MSQARVNECLQQLHSPNELEQLTAAYELLYLADNLVSTQNSLMQTVVPALCRFASGSTVSGELNPWKILPPAETLTALSRRLYANKEDPNKLRWRVPGSSQTTAPVVPWTFTGRRLRNTGLRSADLDHATVTNLNISRFFFDTCQFSHSHISDTIIEFSRFSSSTFSHCSFMRSTLSYSVFENCTFDNVDFRSSTFDTCAFIGCSVKNSALDNCTVNESTWELPEYSECFSRADRMEIQKEFANAFSSY